MSVPLRSRFVLALVAMSVSLTSVPASAADLLDLAVADVLARPGDSVELVARLKKKAPGDINVPGASIELRLDGRTIGRARTDEHGFARLKTAAPERGDHVLKAVYDGSAALMRAEYTALFTVRRSDEPILAVDVDWTLAMTDDLNTARGGVDCPPVVGAPEAITRLSKSFTVIYVTGRARNQRKRTISWLFRYGFPRGSSYFFDPVDYPTHDILAFKTTVLKGLATAFTGLKVGLGNDAEDHKAYAAAGLRSVLLTPETPTASMWGKVEKAIVVGHSAGR